MGTKPDREKQKGRQAVCCRRHWCLTAGSLPKAGKALSLCGKDYSWPIPLSTSHICNLWARFCRWRGSSKLQDRQRDQRGQEKLFVQQTAGWPGWKAWEVGADRGETLQLSCEVNSSLVGGGSGNVKLQNEKPYCKTNWVTLLPLTDSSQEIETLPEILGPDSNT